MSNDHRLLGVQYLRAVAAVMVVYYHLAVQIPAYTPFLEFHTVLDSRSLGAGVHIFFVISGFIMMVTTQTTGAGEFIRRRLIRIAPLYWLLTSAVVILSCLHYFKQTRVTPELVIKSLLFLPYVASSGRVEPVLVPGWTLNVEMFFYAVFAAALSLSRRHRAGLVSFILFGLALSGRLLTGPDQSPALWLFSRDWMLEFCTGLLIGHLYLRNALVWPSWISIALIVGGAGLLMSSWLVSGSPGPYVLPATGIVLGTVAHELRAGFKPRRMSLLLGDASYSIYLSHLFALGFVSHVWDRAGLMTVDQCHAAMFAIISLMTALGAALLIHRFVEKPMLDAFSTVGGRYRPLTLFIVGRAATRNSCPTVLMTGKDTQ